MSIIKCTNWKKEVSVVRQQGKILIDQSGSQFERKKKKKKEFAYLGF